MKKQDEIDLWYACWDNVEDGIVSAREVIEELNIPIKRATYILEKWADKGFIEYGVSLFRFWFEEGIHDGTLEGLVPSSYAKMIKNAFYHSVATGIDPETGRTYTIDCIDGKCYRRP